METINDYSHLKTGFFKARTLFFNPSKDELEDLLGEEVPQPIYTFQRRGVRGCTIDIYLSDVYDCIYKYTIELLEKDAFKEKTGNYQFINCVGDEPMWRTDESELFDSFTGFYKIHDWITPDKKITTTWRNGAIPNTKEKISDKKYRIAKIGEADLLGFLRQYLQVNPYDPDENILVDVSKLFDGDFSYFKKIHDPSSDFQFVAFAYVDTNFQQQILKDLMPINFIRCVNNKMAIDSVYRKDYNRLLKSLEFTNGHYHLGKLQTFIPEFIKSKKQLADDGSDY